MTRIDADARNAARGEFVAATRYEKHRTLTVERYVRPVDRGYGQRQDQTAALGEPFEPASRRPHGAGVDKDRICRRELDLSAIAVDHPHVLDVGKILRRADREDRLILDGGNLTAAPDEMREDRGVITGSSADMDNMIAGFRCGRSDQRRKKRWLAVIEVTLWENTDQDIVIQIGRVGIRGRDIAPTPAQDRPWPAAEKGLAGHCGKSIFQSAILYARGRDDLLGVSTPYDAEPAIAIHVSQRWLTKPWRNDSMGARHLLIGSIVKLPPGCRLSIERDPSWTDREFVDERLGDYNQAFLADSRYDYFGIFVRDETGAIRAGLIGSLYGGWLFINLLWVHADLRRQGVGSALIAEAERRAVDFGCHSAHVDTFSFQGPDFYPRFGYEVFGTLDYPPDHKRIFFQKRLRAEEA